MAGFGTDVAVTHKFISGKADGADPTLVQPSKWNQNENYGGGLDGQRIARDSGQTDGASWTDAETVSLTNHTGSAQVAGDVVAADTTQDSSVVLADVVGSFQKFVVAMQANANAAPGAYAKSGIVTAKAQGAITRGSYVRKSATTLAVETTGAGIGDTVNPTPGAVGLALAAASGGFVTILLFDRTVTGRTAILCFGDVINVIAAATTSYLSVGQKVDSDSTGVFGMPFKGIARVMTVKMTTAAGGSRVATATLEKNAVDTAIVVSITDPATAGTDSAHTAAYASGDIMNVKVVTAAGAAPSRFGAVVQYDEVA